MRIININTPALLGTADGVAAIDNVDAATTHLARVGIDVPWTNPDVTFDDMRRNASELVDEMQIEFLRRGWRLAYAIVEAAERNVRPSQEVQNAAYRIVAFAPHGEDSVCDVYAQLDPVSRMLMVSMLHDVALSISRVESYARLAPDAFAAADAVISLRADIVDVTNATSVLELDAALNMQSSPTEPE